MSAVGAFSSNRVAVNLSSLAAPRVDAAPVEPRVPRSNGTAVAGSIDAAAEGPSRPASPPPPDPPKFQPAGIEFLPPQGVEALQVQSERIAQLVERYERVQDRITKYIASEPFTNEGAAVKAVESFNREAAPESPLIALRAAADERESQEDGGEPRALGEPFLSRLNVVL